MKKYYDEGRHVIVFEVGDYVYLNLQSYKQNKLRKNLSLKLLKIYFGLFKVFERLGDVTCKLKLPPSSR